MLLSYFGFREDPFGVTPDPRFMYEAGSHREALASLIYGVGSGRGFMALLAEPGMGKTSLLHGLLERLQSSARTAFIFQTQCNSRELLAYLLNDFEVKYSEHEHDVVAMHQSLNEVLLREARAGRHCVAVIDEAQNLDHEVLESIRLLSDFETGKSKLLQIILAGQPSLAEKLASPKQEQLRQRISSINWLVPLTLQDVGGYITYRLRAAGYLGAPLFAPEAERLIAEHSLGIPRNINNLCFNALSLCCAEKRRKVEVRMVEEVLADLNLLKPRRVEEPIPEAVAPGSETSPLVTAQPQQQWPRTSSAPKLDYIAPTSGNSPVSAARFPYSTDATARVAIAPERVMPRPSPRAVPMADYAVASRTSRSELKYAIAAVVLILCAAIAALAWHYGAALSGVRLGATQAAVAGTTAEPSDSRTSPETSQSFPSTDGLKSDPGTAAEQSGAQPIASLSTKQPSTSESSGSEGDEDETGTQQIKAADSPLNEKRAPALTPTMGSFRPTGGPDAVPPSAFPNPSDISVTATALPLRANAAMPLYRPAQRPMPPAPTYIAQSSIADLARTPVATVRPVYPVTARQAKVSGDVQMEALVGTDGAVKDVKVVSGHPMLIYAATDAVRKWRFEPLKIDGHAVEFNTRVTIKFSLFGPNS